MATTAIYTPQDIERVLCAKSLPDFLGRVVIPDPPPAGTGAVNFILWPHILRLHAACEATPKSGVLPVGKARKLGVTSYFEARFLWQALYRPGAFLPVISQGEDEAKKVIADCRFIWERLPEHLRGELVADNAQRLGFKGGGVIEAFPATVKAGRSHTGTEVLFDEADFHEYFGASYNALLPLIQDTGGRMFLVSTLNPDKVDSTFRQVYRRASGRVWLGYYERPGRNASTYAAARALASDDYRFEKENAITEEEALAPARTRAYFDVDALQAMLEDVRDPREVLRGLESIWRPPVVAGKYVLGADTAWGQTGSYGCATVLDWNTGEQVAELHGRPHPDEMALECFRLHQLYNHAYMGLERAGEGQERDGESVVVVDKVVALLEECECRDRLFYADYDRKPRPEVPGWRTDGKTRPVMLGELAEAVRMRQIVLRSRAGVGEMLSFIRTEKGRPEAAAGAYDDRVMAYAVAWQMRKHARFGSLGRARAVMVGRAF